MGTHGVYHLSLALSSVVVQDDWFAMIVHMHDKEIDRRRSQEPSDDEVGDRVRTPSLWLLPRREAAN